MFNPQDGYGQLYGGEYGAVEFENPLYHLNAAVTSNGDGYDQTASLTEGYAAVSPITSEMAYAHLSDPANMRLQSNEGYVEVSGGYASLNHVGANNGTGSYDTLQRGTSLADAGYSFVNSNGGMEPAYDFLNGTASADEAGGYGFGDEGDYMQTYVTSDPKNSHVVANGLGNGQVANSNSAIAYSQDDYILVNESLRGINNSIFNAQQYNEAHPYGQEEYVVVNDANESPQGFINPGFDPRAIDGASAYAQEEYVVVNDANDSPQGFTNPNFDPRTMDEADAYTHDEYMEVNEEGHDGYDTEGYGFGPEPVYLESDANPISILSHTMKSWG